MDRGFTIIELLVVMFILALMSALVLPNWNTGKETFALQRSAHKLAQDIRRTQEMALAAAEFEGEVPYGYGVYFNLATTGYIIFADLDNDDDLSWDKGAGVDGVVERIVVEERIEIGQLSSGNELAIAFSPPTPTVAIIPGPSAFIIFQVEGKPGVQKSLCVNNLGLIEVSESCVTDNDSPVVSLCGVTSPADQDPSPGTLLVNVGDQVTFSAKAADMDGSIASWHRDWGDGTGWAEVVACPNSNTCSSFYTYGAAGNYSVKVFVVDDGGAQSGQFTCQPQVTVQEFQAAAGGNLIGYAWSENVNVGWIDFCPGGTPPPGPDPACGRLESDKLRGWARVVDTGEWISLHCESEGEAEGCTSYGVTYDEVEKKFGGEAKWMKDGGGEELICFNSDDC